MEQTEQPASFSIFTIGTPDGSQDVFSIRIPYLLSFLATRDFNGKVEGINDLQAQYEQTYGAGDYTPNTPVTYWTFRWMIGAGALAALRGRVVPVRDARRPGAGPGCRRLRASCCRSCRWRRTRSPGCSPRSAASRGSCSG